MVFPLRAMLTAGITRETSPARCPAAWGAAHTSAGIEIKSESDKASPNAHGDFVFIEDSPDFTACIYRSYWRGSNMSTQSAEPFAHSLHALVNTRRGASLNRRNERARRHIVMAAPARLQSSRRPRIRMPTIRWVTRVARQSQSSCSCSIPNCSPLRSNASVIPSVQKSTESPGHSLKVSVS